MYRGFEDRFSALDFLREFLHDHNSMMALRRILSEGNYFANHSQLGDHEVVDHLAGQLVSGNIRIVSFIPSTIAIQSVAVVWEEEETAEPVTAAAPEEKHWIKLQIVDDDTNEPVEGVPLKIKLPTGEVKEFKSDKNGTIEVRGVPEDTWDIQEMLDPDALEVVKVA